MAMKKTEAVTARFREAVDAHKRLNDFDYVTPLERFLDAPITESDRNRVNKSFARGRFERESESSMKLAFEEAGLDSEDPFAREVLLRLFGISYFPAKQKTRGPKRKWTPQRYSELLSDYNRVKTEKPKFNDQQICKEIAKRFPSRYPKSRRDVKDPGATVRRNLAPARDPSKNTRVAELAEVFAAGMTSEIQKIDPNIEIPAKKVKNQSELSAIKWLSKAWERERNLAK
jgi:hypothetical protein